MVHLKWITQEIEAEKLLSVASLVISVKFRKGCYHYIHIPKKETLVELVGMTLGSFDFTDDPTHGFCMDSVVWSDEDFYHVSFIVGRFTSFSPEIEFLSSL